MSNQILISSGAKLRDLDDVIIGTDGVLSSLGFDVPYGVPRLDANGKILVSELPNSVMEFKGVWNAATNTPTLTNGVGNAGDVYLCNVAGTVNFGAGPITFAVGDYAVYTGSVWARSSGAVGTVTSVAVSRDGDALAITGSPITSSGTINIGFTGTSAQYINGAGNLTTFPSLTGFVPYTGATQNVDLGTYGLLGDFLQLNTSPSSVPTSVGTMSWDSFYKTLQIVTGDGDTTLQVGQEQVTLIHNNTGSTLTDGQVVYVTGSTGELPTVALASNTTEATSSVTFGVVTESIANGADGFITTSGMVHGLNTLAYNEGDALYLGATAGTFTNVKPSAPNNLVLIGYMIKKAGGNGSIFVKIQNGYEISELHDVLITSVANNDGLFYDSATSLWKNKTVAEVLGYTPANDNLVVHKAGAETITGIKTFTNEQLFGNGITLTGGYITYEDNTYNLTLNTNILTANRNLYLPDASGTIALTSDLTGGTVTSVGLSAPTGFSVSGSPVTVSGTLALSFASGYSLPTNVKQSNWDDAYTWVAAFPTQTGNAGKFLTTDGSTLSWAANPLGTVTSVAMTVPTGLSVAGSPITTSGTLAITFTTGYSIPTNASQTNWDTAYTNRITSLTTTGSSGSATLVSNTLNIPTYTLAGLGGVPTTRTLTINGVAQDLSADRTWTIAAGISSVSGTAPISVSTVSGAATVSIATANSTTTGALSSTDWNTFNNKQAGSTNLTSLSALTYVSTSFVKMTSAGTFALDTNTYALASALGSYLPLAGGTMTGSITYSGQLLKNLTNSTTATIINNWGGAGYFGLGANGNHIIRLDQADATTGAWGNATDVVLQLGTKTVLTDSDIGVTVQAKLTNPVTGTGSQNYLPIWNNSGGTTLGNSKISQPDANNIVLNFADTYSLGVKATYVSAYVAKWAIGRTNLSTDSAGSYVDLRYDIAGAEIFEIRRQYSANTFKISINNGVSIIDHLTIASSGAATFNSSVTSTAFVKTGGTSSQYLMADGSVTTGTSGSYLPLAGGTMTGQIVWSAGVAPISFQQGGNTGTYTQTTIYANQNNTSGDVNNGIFIERGYTDTSNTEVRYFVIGARGGSVQWRLSGIGGTYQTDTSEVKSRGEGAELFVGRYSAGAAKLFRVYQSSGDGYLEMRTGADTVISRISGYSGTASYFLSNVLIGTSTNNGTRLNVYSDGNTGVYLTQATNQADAVVVNVTATSYNKAAYVAALADSASAIGFFYYGQANGVKTYAVYPNGNVQNTNGSYGTLSDSRVKQNIVDATPKLESLLKVRIVNYNLIAPYNQEKQIGVVAQELEKIFPSMVYSDMDGVKGVKYSIFIPMLIKAIQEQNETITQLKQEIQNLKNI